MLKKYISLKLAGNVLILLIAAALFFNAVSFFRLFSMGAADTDSPATPTQLYLMAAGAIIILALMLLMLAIRMDYIQAPKWKGYSHTAIWVIFVVLLINLARSITAFHGLKSVLVITVLVILSLFAYRLGMEEHK
ncbi:MAG: hypothetical protein KDD04_07470 [Sinomicrobium sp.]|nr:hypothetical protein [Sinomicrobium sp.]